MSFEVKIDQRDSLFILKDRIRSMLPDNPELDSFRLLKGSSGTLSFFELKDLEKSLFGRAIARQKKKMKEK